MTRTYTMSDKARAQRRGAAHKHGLYATSTVRQTLPPCRAGTCPLGADHYPCTIRMAIDEDDSAEAKALERCPLPLVTDQEVAERIASAIREGDPSKIADLQGMALAAAVHLRDKGLKTLLDDGLSIDTPASFDHETGEVTSYKTVQHPAAWAVMELLKHTGATADQQAVTPKARAEKDRDVSIADALSFMAEKRRQLQEADSK